MDEREIDRRDSGQGWVVVAAITAILTFTSGARLLPGVVLKPITEQFDWDRSDLMVSLSINMVVLSALQPFLGLASDRLGVRKVLVGGTLLLGLCLLPLSRASELWHFYVIYGVVAAVALAAVSPVNVTAIVSGWFDRRRGAALAIATSGAAFGQLMVVPVAAWMLTATDWGTIYLVLAVVILAVLVPVGLLFIRPRRSAPVARGSARHIPLGQPAPSADLSTALAATSFWTLAFGFFVCGFTMAFASAHFISYADDMGMEPTQAADIVAVTAVFSIAGSFLLGLAADRYDRRLVLAATYALRGLAFLMIATLPFGSWLFAYALVLGISWTATTPLTAAIAADLFGRKNLGLIFGTMFSFMNIGFGAGSYFDGLMYDNFASYDGAVVVNAALGLLASLAVLNLARDTLSGWRRPAETPRFEGIEAERQPVQ